MRTPAAPVPEPPAVALEHLCVWATRTTGALASMVWLREAADQPFELSASDKPHAQGALPPADAGPLELAWRERRAVVVQRPISPSRAASQG